MLPITDQMIGGFNFNGISSHEFGLVAQSVRRPTLPAAKVKRVDLPSASGVYDFDELEYELRTITMRITYIAKDYYELRQRSRKIAAWLSVSTWAKLILNDEKDLFYWAKVSSDLDLNHLWESGSVDVMFDCQPFALSIAEENVNIPAGTGSFVNPGTREINYRSPQGSKFLMTVSGANISVMMNGARLTYSGVGPLLLDHVNMEATAQGANVFHQLGGDIDTFFKIVPGQNGINSSGVSNISINYIPMWY